MEPDETFRLIFGFSAMILALLILHYPQIPNTPEQPKTHNIQLQTTFCNDSLLLETNIAIYTTKSQLKSIKADLTKYYTGITEPYRTWSYEALWSNRSNIERAVKDKLLKFCREKGYKCRHIDVTLYKYYKITATIEVNNPEGSYSDYETPVEWWFRYVYWYGMGKFVGAFP